MTSLRLFVLLIAVLGHKALASEPTIFRFNPDSFPENQVAICNESPTGFMGFTRDAKGLKLSTAVFEKRNLDENTMPLDLSIDETRPKTCWFLKTKFEFPVLVRGFNIQGSPTVLQEFAGEIKPGDKKQFKTAGITYDFSFPVISSKNYSCALGDSNDLDLDGGGYEIIMSADFNNDQLPDFIVQNARKYSFQRYQILMSDKTTKKCKPTVSREVYGC